MGIYEDELRQVSLLPQWEVPGATDLSKALSETQAALIKTSNDLGLEGAAAEAIRAKLDRSQKAAEKNSLAVAKLEPAVHIANSALSAAKDAFLSLPGAKIDQATRDQIRLGTWLLGPAIGIIGEVTVAQVENHMAGEREKAAKDALDTFESALNFPRTEAAGVTEGAVVPRANYDPSRTADVSKHDWSVSTTPTGPSGSYPRSGLQPGYVAPATPTEPRAWVAPQPVPTPYTPPVRNPTPPGTPGGGGGGGAGGGETGDGGNGDDYDGTDPSVDGSMDGIGGSGGLGGAGALGGGLAGAAGLAGGARLAGALGGGGGGLGGLGGGGLSGAGAGGGLSGTVGGSGTGGAASGAGGRGAGASGAGGRGSSMMGGGGQGGAGSSEKKRAGGLLGLQAPSLDDTDGPQARSAAAGPGGRRKATDKTDVTP